MDTDICTHQADMLTSTQTQSSLIFQCQPRSPEVSLYSSIFFPRPGAFTSHKPLARGSSNGEQKQASETKEFKNKHQEGHFTQVNTRNRLAAARETKKHRANTPGLNTAPSLTQEVRQSLEKQREQSTGSLSALQRFPRVL